MITVSATEHEKLLPLHDELLKRNAEDIKEIKGELYGIPQRISSLERIVTDLCNNVAENNKTVMELLRGLEGKYQTKEMSEMNNRAIEKRIEELEEEIEDNREEIQGLKKDRDALKNKIIYMSIVLIGQLIAWIFLNHGTLGVK